MKFENNNKEVIKRIIGPIKPLLMAFCPINNPPKIITIF